MLRKCELSAGRLNHPGRFRKNAASSDADIRNFSSLERTGSAVSPVHLSSKYMLFTEHMLPYIYVGIRQFLKISESESGEMESM